MKIFLKTGCIVCALFLLGALFYEWIHSNIYITTSAHPDPHPISHLNTEQPVIALTFDTAAGRISEHGSNLLVCGIQLFRRKSNLLSQGERSSVMVQSQGEKIHLSIVSNSAAYRAA